MIIELLAASMLMNAPVADDADMEFVAACEEYQAEYGGEADCACLGEKVAEDEALAEALAMITGPEDVEAADEATKAAIAACTPHGDDM